MFGGKAHTARGVMPSIHAGADALDNLGGLEIMILLAWFHEEDAQ